MPLAAQKEKTKLVETKKAVNSPILFFCLENFLFRNFVDIFFATAKVSNIAMDKKIPDKIFTIQIILLPKIFQIGASNVLHNGAVDPAENSPL